MHKSLIPLFLICLTLLCPTNSTPSSPSSSALPIYTNKQASDCFAELAIQHCSSLIKNCTENPVCGQQLSMYQSCAFGNAQADIFNGYCFRKWKQNSVLTSKMIDCLIQQCDLLYNSEIGLQELFECTQEVIVDNYEECGQECGKQLNKIRDAFKTRPIKQLFQQQLQNQSAQQIVNVIKTNCLHENRPETQSQRRRNKKPRQTDDKQQGKISEQALDNIILLEQERSMLENIVEDQEEL